MKQGEESVSCRISFLVVNGQNIKLLMDNWYRNASFCSSYLSYNGSFSYILAAKLKAILKKMELRGVWEGGGEKN